MYFIKAVATSTARRLSFCLLAVGFLAAACGTGSAGDSSGAVTPFPGESPAGRSDVSTTGEPENVPNVQGWNTDWSKSTIDLSELRRGLAASDPRDVISPIAEPKLEKVAEVAWRADREPVSLATSGGGGRAHPRPSRSVHAGVDGGEPTRVRLAGERPYPARWMRGHDAASRCLRRRAQIIFCRNEPTTFGSN